MKAVERVVGNVNTIYVSLETDSNLLDEVVVTAFGIKRNPKSLGYAVSNVASDELTENSEPALVRSLAGKVAGVNVNLSTGVAGASNQINIRGATTIGGASQPLIIVDGIAYDIPDPAKYKKDSESIMNELHDLMQRGYAKICRLANTQFE